jgi:hypothetical protein
MPFRFTSLPTTEDVSNACLTVHATSFISVPDCCLMIYNMPRRRYQVAVITMDIYSLQILKRLGKCRHRLPYEVPLNPRR